MHFRAGYDCICIYFSDDGGCKHVVALLLDLISFTERHKDRGTLVGTDSACKWDKPRKESKPMKIVDIDFSRHGEKNPQKKQTVANANKQNEKTFINFLKTSCPSAGALKILTDSESDGSETESDSEADQPTLRMLRLFYEDRRNKPEIVSFLREAYSTDVCNTIEKSTRNQSDDDKWMQQRRGRITASVAHQILHARSTTLDNNDNYISSLIINRPSFTSASTTHGIKSEPIARQEYISAMRKKHRDFKVSLSGLLIKATQPFLGASPDGHVQCGCCDHGLLEIKSPYGHKGHSIDDICNDKNYRYLYKKDDKVYCNEDSSWYTQIQMQLYVADCKWCDLVIYTEVAPYIHIIRVHFASEWWSQKLPILKAFFLSHIWPKLLDVE